MPLSSDAQVVLLLCSRLGLPADESPLTLREWNPLAAKIAKSEFGRHGALLEASAAELQANLELTEDDAERLCRLLDRGGALAIELERLESLGIWVLTRADDDYPARLGERLKGAAPAVLFGSGAKGHVGASGLAVVGSRDVDEEGSACAAFAGKACADAGWVVYSGAARGVDAIAMKACLEAGGNVVGILADSLEKAIRSPLERQALSDGHLTLLTLYTPKSPFSVGAAMGRNKLIYALADYALVVASGEETGGTWSGATEALKAGWCPVFVRDGDNVPGGNKKLLKRGGLPLPFPFIDSDESLPNWITAQASGKQPGTLF
jgi:predicted Rossmann fold nucleotide-binding protein DprA/Smf involved in DNA uptake